MKSIKSNLLAFAVLATLIPSLGLGLLSFWRYQEVINQNVSHELRTLAKDASGELTLWVRERVHEVRTLSTAYTLIDGLGSAMAPPPGRVRIGASELAQYLSSVEKKLDPFLEFTLSDAAGQVVASSGPSPGAIALPAAWANAAITEGVVVAPPRWDAARATAILTIAVPVLSPRNELLGALSGVLDLGTFEKRLQGVARDSPVEVILLATDGTPLLDTKGAATLLPPVAPELLVRLRGEAGEPMSYVGHHGRDVIGVADLPRSLSMVVVAERERADVFDAWLQQLALFVALVAGLTLLVGVVAWLMGRSIVAPLARLTAAADRIARGDLSAGPNDESADEIGRLTRVFNLMTDRLRTSHAEVEAAQTALRQQNALLETLSTTDSLTGLYNRAKFDTLLAEEYACFRRDRRPFAVLMFELDNMPAINADYGYVAGDEVVVKVAALLNQSVRAGDHVARFGGEKFVAVLAETPLDAAMDAAERIRSVVEAPGFLAGKQTIAVTMSIGVAQSREGDDSPDTILFRADHALYEARRAGGNRVQSAM